MDRETRLFYITGKVQGVFFRKSTKEKALEIGVSGEVRNLSDGRVEVRATGSAQQLDQLKSWCSLGPERADVDRVEEQQLPVTDYNSFRIIH